MFMTLEKLGYTLISESDNDIFFVKIDDMYKEPGLMHKIVIDKRAGTVMKFIVSPMSGFTHVPITFAEIQALARMGF